MFTDRNVLCGLLELVLDLSERVTGKRPVITLENDEGDKVKITTSRAVQWVSSQPPALTQVSPHAIDGPHEATCDTLKESSQVA